LCGRRTLADLRCVSRLADILERFIAAFTAIPLSGSAFIYIFDGGCRDSRVYLEKRSLRPEAGYRDFTGTTSVSFEVFPNSKSDF
jgi:hypothetical protein